MEKFSRYLSADISAGISAVWTIGRTLGREDPGCTWHPSDSEKCVTSEKWVKKATEDGEYRYEYEDYEDCFYIHGNVPI